MSLQSNFNADNISSHSSGQRGIVLTWRLLLKYFAKADGCRLNDYLASNLAENDNDFHDTWSSLVNAFYEVFECLREKNLDPNNNFMKI